MSAVSLVIAQAFFVFFTAYSSGASTVTTLTNMSFGKLASAAGGSVTISPSGIRSSAGGVALLSSGPGSAGRLLLSGTPGQAYSISLPANGEVHLTFSGHSLGVTNFTSHPSTSGFLDASGSLILSLGATLNIDSHKPTGDYVGIYTIIVDYP